MVLGRRLVTAKVIEEYSSITCASGSCSSVNSFTSTIHGVLTSAGGGAGMARPSAHSGRTGWLNSPVATTAKSKCSLRAALQGEADRCRGRVVSKGFMQLKEV